MILKKNLQFSRAGIIIYIPSMKFLYLVLYIGNCYQSHQLVPLLQNYKNSSLG